MVAVLPISAEAFAPYGEVLADQPSGDRDAVTAHWTALGDGPCVFLAVITDPPAAA